MRVTEEATKVRRRRAARLARNAFKRFGTAVIGPPAWYEIAAADAIDRRLKREEELRRTISWYEGELTAQRHARYLSTALGAAIVSDPRFADLAAGRGWDTLIEDIAEVARRLYMHWRCGGLVWGETHHQYETLDKVAESYFKHDGKVPDLRACFVPVEARKDGAA